MLHNHYPLLDQIFSTSFSCFGIVVKANDHTNCFTRYNMDFPFFFDIFTILKKSYIK